ncbi:MAG: ABC transporter ATP-binding protein [Candidatus Cloacimonetes bacterium]|nr:ABC transporter ATP-binding protein [Candidatus Cloacimonadota bacterium]
MNYALEVNELSKNYEGFRLDKVSFALPEGFIMGLIGPNGAGKTTIIKLIMNLVMKNSGSIKVFGKDNREHEIEIKERIGFVYDNPNYYEHLNLQQIRNIIAPFYKRWDNKVFDDLVTRFELPLKKNLKKFSRGMVMKAAIAVALSHHADFIIMDEPTSGLDPLFRRELLDLLFDLLQNEKKSILFSTHITSDLERVADYITFINKGKIVFSNTKDEIMENHALIKGDKNLINIETKGYFEGMRINEMGFEALTSDVKSVKKKFGNSVIIDKANLEDMMYFYNQKQNND